MPGRLASHPGLLRRPCNAVPLPRVCPRPVPIAPHDLTATTLPIQYSICITADRHTATAWTAPSSCAQGWQRGMLRCDTRDSEFVARVADACRACTPRPRTAIPLASERPSTVRRPARRVDVPMRHLGVDRSVDGCLLCWQRIAGNGIYGSNIEGGVVPTDLDVCNGRHGVTPDSGGQVVYYYVTTQKVLTRPTACAPLPATIARMFPQCAQTLVLCFLSPSKLLLWL